MTLKINEDLLRSFKSHLDRCVDDLIEKRMMLVGDDEDACENMIQWHCFEHKELREAYYSDALSNNDMAKLNTLIDSAYDRYKRQADSGFGRIRML